jgi:hypothetical protein
MRQGRRLWILATALVVGCVFNPYSGSDPAGSGGQDASFDADPTRDAVGENITDASAGGSDALTIGDAAHVDGGLDAGLAQQRKLFVTRETFQGNLGGATGANTLCRAFAADAGLFASTGAGSFVALLPAGAGTPLRAGVVYHRVDGVRIGTKQELITAAVGGLPVDGGFAVDQHGVVVADGKAAWTGLDSNLVPAAANCAGFTSSSMGVTGHVGAPEDNTRWVDSKANPGDANCNVLVHLYCFEAN